MKYLALIIEPHKSHNLELKEFQKYFVGNPSFMVNNDSSEFNFINVNYYSFIIQFCKILSLIVDEKRHEEFIGSIPFGLAEFVYEYPERVTKKILDDFIKGLSITFHNKIRIESRHIHFRGLRVLNVDRTSFLVKSKTSLSPEFCKKIHISMDRVQKMKKNEYLIRYIMK